jgi:hypothetical protein
MEGVKDKGGGRY